MAGYGDWKERTFSVTSLHLDPLNPRIPESGEPLGERELIADLVHHDKVYELAKSIVQNGYFPGEAIICVDEGKRRLVVEGNRRVAALKLLLSPEASPEEFESRFRALSARVGDQTPRKVKALLAPSRIAANLIVMHKHTEHQVMQWKPPMQAKFFQNLVDSGLPVEDISEQYSIKESKIRDALQKHTLYSIACSLELPEHVAEKVRNPRSFSVTTLHRLHDNPRVNEFLGISFDEEKRLVGEIDPQEFTKAYSKIVGDIAGRSITSRTLNRTEDMDAYLKSFGHKTPDPAKKGSFSAETLLKRKVKEPKRTGKRRPRARRKKRQTALIPGSMECTLNNQRVKAVFSELQKINLSSYPNAVSVLLRGLLEMALGHYLDRTGHLQKMIADERDRQKRRSRNYSSKWHPTLDNMLKYVSHEDDTIIQNPNLRKAIGKLRAEKESPISVDSLNLFVHNAYHLPDEEKLRALWTRLAPLFDIILTEPDSEGTG